MKHYYAHSVEGMPTSEWQMLEVHLTEVAELSNKFAKTVQPGEKSFAELARRPPRGGV